MTELAETGKELQGYPEDFTQWLRRKVSVMELAMLAANYSESTDTGAAVPRAVRLLYEAWKTLKQ
jgi:hypothetical protein